MDDAIYQSWEGYYLCDGIRPRHDKLTNDMTGDGTQCER